ncbi:MAG: YHS domain-containing protein [Candidatus Limnocylindria bacterium]
MQATPQTDTDPVCGMEIDPELARRNGLTVEHEQKHFYFCGRGCMLDFRDDPTKYLDARYVPRM